jgi:hypothetical protein
MCDLHRRGHPNVKCLDLTPVILPDLTPVILPQALRAGSAHRKGDEYKKAADYFEVGQHDLPKVFRNILTHALALLSFLNSLLKSD